MVGSRVLVTIRVVTASHKAVVAVVMEEEAVGTAQVAAATAGEAATEAVDTEVCHIKNNVLAQECPEISNRGSFAVN